VPDKNYNYKFSTCMDTIYIIYLPTPMFDHFLESYLRDELSLRDDSNKWLSKGFGEEIGILEFKIRSYLVPLF